MKKTATSASKEAGKKKATPTDKVIDKKLNDFLHTLGDNLYAFRVNRKITLKSVANATKIAPATLRNIEKGCCAHCRFTLLLLLCRHYDISLTDIATKGKFKLQQPVPAVKNSAPRKGTATKKIT